MAWEGNQNSCEICRCQYQSFLCLKEKTAMANRKESLCSSFGGCFFFKYIIILAVLVMNLQTMGSRNQREDVFHLCFLKGKCPGNIFTLECLHTSVNLFNRWLAGPSFNAALVDQHNGDYDESFSCASSSIPSCARDMHWDQCAATLHSTNIWRY